MVVSENSDWVIWLCCLFQLIQCPLCHTTPIPHWGWKSNCYCAFEICMIWSPPHSGRLYLISTQVTVPLSSHFHLGLPGCCINMGSTFLNHGLCADCSQCLEIPSLCMCMSGSTGPFRVWSIDPYICHLFLSIFFLPLRHVLVCFSSQYLWCTM